MNRYVVFVFGMILLGVLMDIVINIPENLESYRLIFILTILAIVGLWIRALNNSKKGKS